MKHLHWLLGIAASVVITTHATETFAQAENYEPLRFDSGLTGSYVSASGRGGFGALAELKFMVHDNIAVGARAEGEVMFGGNIGAEGDVQMDIAAVSAGFAKAEYYLGTGSVRPMVGFGLGVFNIGSQSISAGQMTAGVDQKAGRYFGVAPQIGIDLGRVRFAATYNAILGASIEVRQTVGTVEQTESFSQNYFAFEMSVRFGGGRKRPPPQMILVPVGAPPPPPGYGPTGPTGPTAPPPGYAPPAPPAQPAPADAPTAPPPS